MTNAKARFNKFLRPRKPEGSLGRTAQDVHLDSHTQLGLNYELRCVKYVLFRAKDPFASVHYKTGMCEAGTDKVQCTLISKLVFVKHIQNVHASAFTGPPD